VNLFVRRYDSFYSINIYEEGCMAYEGRNSPSKDETP
jgi:hypothetical protein